MITNFYRLPLKCKLFFVHLEFNLPSAGDILVFQVTSANEIKTKPFLHIYLLKHININDRIRLTDTCPKAVYRERNFFCLSAVVNANGEILDNKIINIYGAG